MFLSMVNWTKQCKGLALQWDLQASLKGEEQMSK